MPLITQGPEGEQAPYGVNKTNWKFLAIVIVLAVIVGGVILFCTKFQEIPLVEFPEIEVPEKIVEYETADWKIYRNEQYGFEIEYPADYFVSVTADEVSFVHKKWKDVIFTHPYVSVTVFETEYSADEWVKQEIEERRKEGFGAYEDKSCQMHCISAAAEEIRIGNNIRALQYKWWGVSAGGKYIVAEKGSIPNQLFVIYSHIAGAREAGQESVPEEILNNMLSTFRFIETTEEFCGWSTEGVCVDDSDCTAGGCSDQVCQSKSEDPIVTTCEFKECYVPQNYGLGCKCADNKCQWSK